MHIVFRGIKLAQQQQECLDQFSELKTGETLKIEAGAGASKTFTSTAMAVKVVPNVRGLYLAYNNHIVEEVRSQFPNCVDVMTTHGLAYQYVGRFYKARLESVLTLRTYLSKFGRPNVDMLVSDAQFYQLVNQSLRNFCLSDDEQMSERHVKLPIALSRKPDCIAFLTERVLEATWKLFETLSSKHCDLPITHDFYLKLFVLRLKQNQIRLPYNYVMLDEAQDTAPVVQQLFTLLEAKRVALGDRCQSIYEWRGAVNFMQTIQCERSAELTTCYRFGSAVAELANATTKAYLDLDTDFRGNPQRESVIITDPRQSEADPNRMLICRTNAKLFSELMRLHRQGQNAKILKDTDKLQRLLIGIRALKENGSPSIYVPEIAGFNNYNELLDHAQNGAGGDIMPLIRSIDEYGLDKLERVFESATSNAKKENVVTLTTGHASKGAEADHVELASDFDYCAQGEDGQVKPEEGRLMYVALTRPRFKLDISRCKKLSSLLEPSQAGSQIKVNVEAKKEQSDDRPNPSLEKLNFLLGQQ